MPPLPTITDVYRVTWNFSPSEGVTPRIVQHYYSPNSDVDVFGASLIAVMVDDLFYPMPGAFEPLTIDVLPLDGTTPTQSFNLPNGIAFCSGDSDMSPASAYVMSLRTAQRGPRGRGRSYIGPVADSTIQDGQVFGESYENLQVAWAAFLEAASELDPLISLCVASYTHSDQHVVTGITFRQVLGTQRRRQDQLR